MLSRPILALKVPKEALWMALWLSFAIFTSWGISFKSLDLSKFENFSFNRNYVSLLNYDMMVLIFRKFIKFTDVAGFFYISYKTSDLNTFDHVLPKFVVSIKNVMMNIPKFTLHCFGSFGLNSVYSAHEGGLVLLSKW